jgi:signal peptidase I
MTEVPDSQPGSAAPSAVPGRSLRWIVAPAVVLLVVLLVRAFLYAPFSIPSRSMEPTLQVGDRILVDRTVDPGDLRRGDLIVFDAAAAFGVDEPDSGPAGRLLDVLGSLVGRGPETDYVKRVIGLPGDRVVCCDDDDRLVVNGEALVEPYLYPGDKASETAFDIAVPAGRYWVMGDHRSASADSRAHLGAPGGGTVAAEDIIGQVRVRYWPFDRGGSIGPSAYTPTSWNGQ